MNDWRTSRARTRATTPIITILVDTREQRVPAFGDGVIVVRATLAEGDYTTPRLAHVARIERKSRADFAASITWGRERLDREMVRLQAYPWRCILVEAAMADFNEYKDADFGRRGVHAHAVEGTVASYWTRYAVPIFFVSDAATCARVMVAMLRRWEELHTEQA